MQSPKLPVQLTSASPAPSTPRTQGGQPDGGPQFSAALSREMSQHQPASAPAPKAAPPAKGAAPQQQAKPAQPDNAAKPATKDQAAEPAAPAKADSPNDQPADEGAERAAADAAAAAAGNPLYELMAMVASFNPAPAAPAQAATVATAAPGSAAQPGIALGADAALTAAAARLTGQAADAGAPAQPGAHAPDATFSNMMGKVDGAMQDGLESAAPPLAQPRGTPAPVAVVQGAPQARASQGEAPRPDAVSTVQTTPAAAAQAPLAAAVQRETLPEKLILKEAAPAALAIAPMQAAAVAPLQSGAAVHAAERIAARVGTPAWDNQVAQKIVWMVAGKEQSATLTLNPPDMGPMQVVLSVTNDQASVTFSAAQPEVRQALQDAMPKLREMMGENGIALGNASVHDGSGGQQQQAQGEPGRPGNAGAHAASGSAVEAEARVAARPARAGELPGLVDTFA